MSPFLEQAIVPVSRTAAVPGRSNGVRTTVTERSTRGGVRTLLRPRRAQPAKPIQAIWPAGWFGFVWVHERKPAARAPGLQRFQILDERAFVGLGQFSAKVMASIGD